MKAGDEVGEAVEEAHSLNCCIGWEAAVSYEALESWLPGANKPSVGRAHGVTEAADPASIDLRPADQEVDGAAHVENVLPGQAFAGNGVLKEFKAFVFVPFEVWVPSVLEGEGVWTKDDIAESSQFGTDMVHGVSGESCWFALSPMPLRGVLMPDRDRRCGAVGGGCIGDQQVCGYAMLGFDLEFDRYESVAILLNDFSGGGV